ncbi:MAG: GyrI-like domain-containing protein [Clostridiales bacterium]|nr:GyrI-like domain-containing protein [Clostridiales bacterium]
MLKIGEFSKLTLLTVKALRFYEKEGILVPALIDEWTGYRFYDTSQLETAARIKAYRQLDLSVREIKAALSGMQIKEILAAKAEALRAQQEEIRIRLSIIHHILEDNQMRYQAVIKRVPAAIVYYEEKRLSHIKEKMTFIPESGDECMRLNPDLQCTTPEYEFIEYLDSEYKETDVLIRHSQAVTRFGNENERIKFKEVPATRVISIYHKGSYEQLGEAYAYLAKYAEENGYHVKGLARECYIDGIWNKEAVEDWLTEIQLPIE